MIAPGNHGNFDSLRDAPPPKKPPPLRQNRSKKVTLWRCGLVGYIGEVALARGSATLKPSPMTISLVTFLFGHKKVTRIVV